MKSRLTLWLLCLLQLGNAQKLEWVAFDWEGDTIGSQFYEKAAILIPIKIENLKYNLNAQFDLGAPNTMLYGNTLEPILAMHPSIKKKVDTSQTVWIQSSKNPVLKNLKFVMQNVSFGRHDIAVFKDYGDSLTIDSLSSATIKHIGTIGADLFSDKVLIIDYPGRKLAATSKVPKKYAGASFIHMTAENGRIKLPIKIGETSAMVLFDTGSSIFQLLTDSQNIKTCVPLPSSIIDTIKVTSWGEEVALFGRIGHDITLANKVFKSCVVYESKEEDLVRFNAVENIIGITGNALFLDNIIILDFVAGKFGIYTK